MNFGDLGSSFPRTSSLKASLANSLPKEYCWAKVLSKYKYDSVTSVSRKPKLASRIKESVRDDLNFSKTIGSTSWACKKPGRNVLRIASSALVKPKVRLEPPGLEPLV